jgi:dTDP-4-dehydrorhamnose reductase
VRIVLTGAGGQLASELRPILAPLGDLVEFAHAQLDICAANAVESRLTDERPDLVVNAAAFNQVDRSESEPAEAFAVNAFGALNLARACFRARARLVHFSTDYVFGLDAMRTEPWRETDQPGPINVYGASKLVGEQFIQAYQPDHLIVRTCGLYGRAGSRGKGGNFVETMLRLARSNQTVRVVDDQICTPSSAKDVARATVQLVQAGATGLFHVTNSGSCTWFEFAREIFRLAPVAAQCVPISSQEYPGSARRPAYSVLCNDRLHAAGVDPCPTWQNALGRYLEERSVAGGG